MTTTIQSLRKHPQLHSLFKEAESRFLNEEELEFYLAEYPEGSAPAKASGEIKAIANQITKKVITRIYEIYPFESNHELAMPKCTRDVRYVIAYATLAMLMQDIDWFRDKLLIWMKTIIQSFGYPDIAKGEKPYFEDTEVVEHLGTLKSHHKSIYETYYAIREDMRSNLSEEAYNEIEPYITVALDVLAHD
jgi:hypothetical protein